MKEYELFANICPRFEQTLLIITFILHAKWPKKAIVIILGLYKMPFFHPHLSQHPYPERGSAENICRCDVTRGENQICPAGYFTLC